MTHIAKPISLLTNKFWVNRELPIPPLTVADHPRAGLQSAKPPRAQCRRLIRDREGGGD